MPLSLMQGIRKRARQRPSKVVFSPGDDPRAREAAWQLAEQKLAKPVLISDSGLIESASVSAIEVIDPGCHGLSALEKAHRRREEAMDETAMGSALEDPLYFGSLMVAEGLADAFIAMSPGSMDQVIDVAALTIGYSEGVSAASSFVLMEHGEGGLILADAAMTARSSSSEAAAIVASMACNAGILLGVEPRVALLANTAASSERSFAIPRWIEEIVEAARALAPGFPIDGRASVSEALAPVAAFEMRSDPPGRESANVLVFPRLAAAGLGLEIAQVLTGRKCFGPVLQGFAKPVGSVPATASTQEIVDLATTMAVLA